jgi:hypothetical protein
MKENRHDVDTPKYCRCMYFDHVTVRFERMWEHDGGVKLNPIVDKFSQRLLGTETNTDIDIETKTDAFTCCLIRSSDSWNY